ncbi:MAG TPA: hypothetical protein VFV78_04575 [Vicinamibacterales bacterium]|nr:hypothetical protein [Vicinamibacterales bacterium]
MAGALVLVGLLSGATVGPMAGQAPSTSTGARTMFETGGVQLVGLHIWFENAAGEAFAEPSAAGAGTRVKMHLRGNAAGFVSVWMADATHESIELTPRTDAGPDGLWTGSRLGVGQEFAVTRDLVVGSGSDITRVVMLLGRSQTGQVGSLAECREKLRRIGVRRAADGGPELVSEIDRTTPGRVGHYVVNRSGNQTGVEIPIASAK